MQRPFPAYEGNEPFIFVCYAHDDAEQVYPEIVRLRDAGLHIWYDEGISPGSEWSATLAEHIQQCAVFLYFITPRSVDREHCRREVNFALEQRCAILPVHLEETDVPAALQLNLSHRQAILKYQLATMAYQQKLDRALESAALGRAGMPDAPTQQILQIGDWLLDPGSQCLRRGDESRSLDPKDLSVLLHLAECAPDLVATDALLERSWPGIVVGDNALHQVIGRLRRAFGDDARTPKYLKTLPKRGYRLMVTVRSIEPARAAVLAAAPGTVPGSRRHGKSISLDRRHLAAFCTVIVVAGLLIWGGSNRWFAMQEESELSEPLNHNHIAVIKFQDLSPEGDLAWLAEGLETFLRQQLSLYDEQDISVVPAELSQGAIGDLPKEATALVGGSVISSGEESVTVSLRMTDIASERLVWTKTFSGTIDNPLDLQLTIAAQVAKLTGSTVRMQDWGPQQPEARTPFLKWLHYRYGGEADRELYWLEQTLAQDPEWVNGWLNLLEFRIWESRVLNAPEATLQAREHLRQAGRFADESQPLLAYEALIIDAEVGPLAEVETLLHKNMALYGYLLQSGLPHAVLMLDAGLYREARNFLEYLVEMDPFTGSYQALAFARSLTGDPEGAMEATLTHARFYGQALRTRYPLAYLLPQAAQFEEAQALDEEMAEVLNRTRESNRQHGVLRVMTGVLRLNVGWYSSDRRMLSGMVDELSQSGDWKAFLFAAAANDTRAQELAETYLQNVTNRPHWGFAMASLPPPLRTHPVILRVGEGLGYTPEWRLELCRRVAELPAITHLTCDPPDYE